MGHRRNGMSISAATPANRPTNRIDSVRRGSRAGPRGCPLPISLASDRVSREPHAVVLDPRAPGDRPAAAGDRESSRALPSADPAAQTRCRPAEKNPGHPGAANAPARRRYVSGSGTAPLERDVKLESFDVVANDDSPAQALPNVNRRRSLKSPASIRPSRILRTRTAIELKC